MKKILMIVSLFLLTACTNEVTSYEGSPLKIAVIGDVPEIKNEKVQFESISLEEFDEDIVQISTSYDAVMVTPKVFEEASDDKYHEVYNKSEMPIIFFDSEKSHYPFTREGVTYNSAHWDSLKNGSHTTIFLADVDMGKEDYWYFYLKNEKELNKLYKDVFEKIESL